MSVNCVGLDIGSTSVKVVQLREGKKTIELTSFGIEPLAPQSIVDGSIMNQSAVVDSIRSVFARLRIREKRVAIAVGGHSVIIKKIAVPQMTEGELKEQIRWEAEHHVPFDPQDVQIDYQVLSQENAQGQMDLLLVAAKNELLNDYAAVVRDAQLKPVVIDLAAFAVQNTFERNYGFHPEDTIALINVGASLSTISIVTGGATNFTREVTIGGNAFTEEIQKQLGVGFEEAEAYKLGAVNPGAGSVVPGDVERQLQRVSEMMAGEFQRSLDFYLATTAGSSLSKIYLSGGSAQVSSLRRAVAAKSRLEVDVMDPFLSVKVDQSRFDMPYLRAQAPLAVVAFGLALRQPGDSI
ncbi:MAG: type IV pilus assembly protein PilM [Polyangia bacterium]|jgi:type IV pilus assembly protein PilM|nr:type IV pilus assembly protein PilM [Polyangia bacterium]